MRTDSDRTAPGKRPAAHRGWDHAWGTLSGHPSARPLFRPAPRSAMVFPLVVLIAILPGLVAVNAWDLTPPGPLWGLRGLAVLDGMVFDQAPAAAEIGPVQEAAAYRAVALQPPLYAWLEAGLFELMGDRSPVASVLPSYIAGALAIVLVYYHARLWRGAGMGLAAAFLVGFNQDLLLRMQVATPTTLALCGTLAALWAYGQHERVVADSQRLWSWAGPTVWAVVGGLAMGLALLALSGLAFIVVPIVVFHQFYLRGTAPAPRRGARPRRWAIFDASAPGRLSALIALATAAVVAAPWFLLMFQRHGGDALAALLVPPEQLLLQPGLGLPGRLIALAPATLPLGIYGAFRAVRLALADESNAPESVGGAFWVIWLAVAALAPVVWPSGPQSAFDLVLLVPLSLLAAQTSADLVHRRVPVRALVYLAPMTATTVAWWSSATLRDAMADVIQGHASPATVLGLHLALDLVVVSVWLVHALNRWARRRDDRQRRLLAGFLAAVVALAIVDGVMEVAFSHKIDHSLLALRTMVLRRDRERPFEVVAVVGAPGGAAAPRPDAPPFSEGPSPGGRLRFILKTALPNVPQRDLTSAEDLFKLPEGQRLVILAGAAQPPKRSELSQLGLESIHPGESGVLEVFATISNRTARGRGRAATGR